MLSNGPTSVPDASRILCLQSTCRPAWLAANRTGRARSHARAPPVDLHHLVELGRTLLVVDLFGRDYAGLRIGVKLHLLAVLGAFPFPLTVVGF